MPGQDRNKFFHTCRHLSYSKQTAFYLLRCSPFICEKYVFTDVEFLEHSTKTFSFLKILIWYITDIARLFTSETNLKFHFWWFSALRCARVYKFVALLCKSRSVCTDEPQSCQAQAWCRLCAPQIEIVSLSSEWSNDLAMCFCGIQAMLVPSPVTLFTDTYQRVEGGVVGTEREREGGGGGGVSTFTNLQIQSICEHGLITKANTNSSVTCSSGFRAKAYNASQFHHEVFYV